MSGHKSAKKFAYYIRYSGFCKLVEKKLNNLSESLSTAFLSTAFYIPCFMLSVVNKDVPELSNDNNQPKTTSYVLLRHACFNILTKIHLFGFILTLRHACT